MLRRDFSRTAQVFELTLFSRYFHEHVLTYRRTITLGKKKAISSAVTPNHSGFTSIGTVPNLSRSEAGNRSFTEAQEAFERIDGRAGKVSKGLCNPARRPCKELCPPD